jgi:hypothetical protein
VYQRLAWRATASPCNPSCKTTVLHDHPPRCTTVSYRCLYTPHHPPVHLLHTHRCASTLDVVRLMVTARIPSSVTEHSLRSSVSAVKATAKTFT